MVAGGAGGGGNMGGGGGAGGLVYTAGTSLTNGATKTIVSVMDLLAVYRLGLY